MAARESITHEGRVVEVTPAVTSVEIISESACSACHAKSLCSLGESKSKIIEVPTRLRDGLVPGDKVVVIAVYYLILWMLRKPLRNEYIFNIKK